MNEWLNEWSLNHYTTSEVRHNKKYTSFKR